MFRSFAIQLLAGIGGLWLATYLIENVEFTGSTGSLVLAGSLLAVANTILKPILNLITLPARIITLGLSGILVNMALVWGVDILFPELIIPGIVSLFLATVIIWGLGTLLQMVGKRAAAPSLSQ